MHLSKLRLEIWKKRINDFFKKELKLELHPEKSRLIPLSKGVDFVGFRIFYYFKLLRKRSIRKILFRIRQYKNKEITREKLLDCIQGWNAYAKWADTHKLKERILKEISL